MRCTFHPENAEGGSNLVNSNDFSSVKTPSKSGAKNVQEFSTPAAKIIKEDKKIENNNNNKINNNNEIEVKQEKENAPLENIRFDHSLSSDDDEKMRKLNEEVNFAFLLKIIFI